MEKETEITDMFNIVLVNPEIPPNTGNISRKLNIIQRKQNDWKTVEERFAK